MHWFFVQRFENANAIEIYNLFFSVIPKGSMMDGQTRREAEGKRREEQEKELQVVLLRLQNEYRNQDIVSVISQHGSSQVDKYCLVSLLLF